MSTFTLYETEYCFVYLHFTCGDGRSRDAKHRNTLCLSVSLSLCLSVSLPFCLCLCRCLCLCLCLSVHILYHAKRRKKSLNNGTRHHGGADINITSLQSFAEHTRMSVVRRLAPLPLALMSAAEVLPRKVLIPVLSTVPCTSLRVAAQRPITSLTSSVPLRILHAPRDMIYAYNISHQRVTVEPILQTIPGQYLTRVASPVIAVSSTSISP